jgi:hypothetical protein
MQAEPATLVHMPEDCGATIHQPSLPLIVMDAGLASNDNIAWLIELGYHYLVVGRERKRQALSLLSLRAENEKRQGIRNRFPACIGRLRERNPGVRRTIVSRWLRIMLKIRLR